MSKVVLIRWLYFWPGIFTHRSRGIDRMLAWVVFGIDVDQDDGVRALTADLGGVAQVLGVLAGEAGPAVAADHEDRHGAAGRFGGLPFLAAAMEGTEIFLIWPKRQFT